VLKRKTMENKFSYHPEGFIEAKKWLDEIGKYAEVAENCKTQEGDETNGFKLVREANKMWGSGDFKNK
jgi:hypothetical protein